VTVIQTIRRGGRRGSGQSLVEFALILPLMLTFVGLTLDVARLFQARITLESLTRDAAEYAAGQATTSSQALTAAREVVCLGATGLPGFVAGPTPEECVQPSVAIASFSSSTDAPGATADYPIVRVAVQTSLPFNTLLPYPLFTQDGAWNLGSTRDYSLMQNR